MFCPKADAVFVCSELAWLFLPTPMSDSGFDSWPKSAFEDLPWLFWKSRSLACASTTLACIWLIGDLNVFSQYSVTPPALKAAFFTGEMLMGLEAAEEFFFAMLLLLMAEARLWALGPIEVAVKPPSDGSRESPLKGLRWTGPLLSTFWRGLAAGGKSFVAPPKRWPPAYGSDADLPLPW